MISAKDISVFLFALLFPLWSLAEEHDMQLANKLIRNQPVEFLENKGQMADMNGNPVPFVLFKASAPGVDMYITEKGITYAFLKFEEEHKEEVSSESAGGGAVGKKEEDENKKIEWERIDMDLRGSSIKKENIITEGKSAHFNQYFLGHCPDGITDVRSYNKITIKDIYPGIDWVFYNSSEKGFKYDFIVHPGADPNLIQLVYSSLSPIVLNSKGGLDLKSNLGSISEDAPYSYIKETGKQVNSSFNISNQEALTLNNEEYYQTTISFNFFPKGGDQEAALPPLGGNAEGASTLIIDPQLFWCTFYRGSTNDGPMSVTSDNSGNLFVTGYTASSNFPMQNAGTYFQGTKASSDDMFILKFSNSGQLIWATFYGGNGDERGNSITTDSNDNILITGNTSSTNFPTQNPTQASFGGGWTDVIVLKFDNSANRLWATYYGGSGEDRGFSICTDNNDNIWVTGLTSSVNFPLKNTGTFFQSSMAGGSHDLFLLKFDNNYIVKWASYYGGSDYDVGHSITNDSNDNILITGMTKSTNLPLQNSGTFFQVAYGGGDFDAYILKFDNAGNRLWATYYGGNHNDIGYTIKTDRNDNIFLTGITKSTDFPTQNAGTFFQGTYRGASFLWACGDAFIIKFDNNNTRLWATYYGGSGDDQMDSYANLTIDKCGSFYISFHTNSTNIITKQACDGGYYDNSFANSYRDIFLAQFSNDGILLWSSYFGGNGSDFRSPITLDNSGSLFLSGEWYRASSSGTYPLKNPGGGAYYVSTYSGGTTDDGFMAKFNKTAATLSTSVANNGCCNSSAMVIVNGPCSPYDYFWSNGIQMLASSSASNTVSNLCPGVYSVTVVTNCDTLVESNIVVSGGSGGISLSAAQVNASCSGLGTATVTAVGGSIPYTYSWSAAGGWGQTDSIATGLSAGTYSVLVTDNAGCTHDTIIVITSSGGPSVTSVLSSSVSCFGGSDGSAWTLVSGGALPYTYLWNPSGGLDSIATGLSAGTYSVVVTDNSGCSALGFAVVNEPAMLSISVSTTSVTCFAGTNGTANANVSGGGGGYSYVWTNSLGATVSNVSSLAADSYSVVVTDANGCTAMATAVVSQPSVLLSLGLTGSDLLCFNDNSGSITSSASGGLPPYSYNWSNGMSTYNVSNLSAGTYSLLISDANGCVAQNTISITQPDLLTASVSSASLSCFGASDGSASVSAAGGTFPYSYNWSGGQNTAFIASLIAGVYSATITDFNGCVASNSVSVAEPSDITIVTSATIATCSTPGSALVSASGDTESFSYLWNTGDTDDTLMAVSAGPYSVVVTDGNGCSKSAAVIVPGTPSPSVTMANVFDVSCFGGSDGSASAIASSGLPPYAFLWSNGTTDLLASGLSAGSYSVAVTDDNGCSANASVTINEPSALNAILSSVPSVCSGQSALISANASGGTPAYSYAWSNGTSAASVNVNPTTSTSYSLQVMDANGCAFDTLVFVSVNALPVLSFSSDTTQGCAPLCVNFVNTTQNSQSAHWQFIVGSWQTGDSVVFCFDNPGSYDVTLSVTDNNGCSDSLSLNNYISVHSSPFADFFMTPDPSMVNTSVFFTDMSSDAVSWLWSFGDANNSASSLQSPSFAYADSGTYQVQLIVTNLYGCMDTVSKLLVVGEEFTFYTPNAFTPNGDGINEVFSIKGTGIDPDDFELYIYDRWGNMIFKSNDLNAYWDGRANGGKNIAQIDTFVWMVSLKDFQGQKHSYVGHVNIVK